MNRVSAIPLLNNPFIPARAAEWEQQALVTRDEKRGLAAENYLKGAVHEGLVQVDDDTVPAVVCYTDLWQQELGWWLRRQKE